MSLPPNQTILFKNFWSKMSVFLSVCSLVLAHRTFVTDHSPVPSSCQIPHELSHLHLSSRVVSTPRMTDSGSQASSQNTALDRWWENSRDTRMGSRGIFLWTGSVCPLRRKPEIIPGLGSCHSFQIQISIKPKKFKYKLTWLWDPKPHLGKALLFCCLKNNKPLFIFI